MVVPILDGYNVGYDEKGVLKPTLIISWQSMAAKLDMSVSH